LKISIISLGIGVLSQPIGGSVGKIDYSFSIRRSPYGKKYASLAPRRLAAGELFFRRRSFSPRE
jgi:hypothetical protein